MNQPSQRQLHSIDYEEVRLLFQDFLESITTIDTLIDDENTPEEIAYIEAEIDHVLDIADETYCRLVGNDITLPSNYNELDQVIQEESRETGIPEPTIEMALNDVLAEHDEISACSAWIKTRRRLERERQLRVISGGQTTPRDWQAH